MSSGVRESAVLGIARRPQRGSRVVAFVVRADPMLDEQRLRAFWSERLVDYQRPKGRGALWTPCRGNAMAGKSAAPRRRATTYAAKKA